MRVAIIVIAFVVGLGAVSSVAVSLRDQAPAQTPAEAISEKSGFKTTAPPSPRRSGCC